MKTILRTIDSISNATGKTARWLAPAIVALIALEVIMRYIFNAPTMWNYETVMMAGGCMIALSWTYVHRHQCHIRIDVIYSHLSPRARAGIDVAGTLLLFFPLIFLFTGVSILWALDSWATGEVSIDTYWYPPLAPFRTVAAIGFILLSFQGIVQFIRDFYLLIGRKLNG